MILDTKDEDMYIILQFIKNFRPRRPGSCLAGTVFPAVAEVLVSCM